MIISCWMNADCVDWKSAALKTINTWLRQWSDSQTDYWFQAGFTLRSKHKRGGMLKNADRWKILWSMTARISTMYWRFTDSPSPSERSDVYGIKRASGSRIPGSWTAQTELQNYNIWLQPLVLYTTSANSEQAYQCAPTILSLNSEDYWA